MAGSITDVQDTALRADVLFYATQSTDSLIFKRAVGESARTYQARQQSDEGTAQTGILTLGSIAYINGKVKLPGPFDWTSVWPTLDLSWEGRDPYPFV